MLDLDGGSAACAGGGHLSGRDSLDAARARLQALESAGEALAKRPALEIAGVLGRVGDRFLNPHDPLRREAEARIPEEAGFSAEMARVVVEGMARDWTAERLERLIYADFPDPSVLDGFRPAPQGGSIRAWGGRFAFHVGAGTVPGVSATSLIRSLLVKCPLLLKPGRGDRALPELFLRGLAEADAGLANAAAVEYWRGGEATSLEAEALRRADRVVAYGGTDTLTALRARLPVTTHFVAYHHRISVGAVAREVLSGPNSAREVAAAAARALSVFDHRGCVSPQYIWVEEGGAVAPVEWARLLADELARLESTLPPGDRDIPTASAWHQLRGTAELRMASGAGNLVLGMASGDGWLVLYEPTEVLAASSGGRVIQISPIAGLNRLPGSLKPYRGLLQTLALAAPDARRREVAESVHPSGVTRITTFEDQPWPPAWWRHDGQGPLLRLVQWISEESTKPRRGRLS